MVVCPLAVLCHGLGQVVSPPPPPALCPTPSACHPRPLLALWSPNTLNSTRFMHFILPFYIGFSAFRSFRGCFLPPQLSVSSNVTFSQRAPGTSSCEVVPFPPAFPPKHPTVCFSKLLAWNYCIQLYVLAFTFGFSTALNGSRCLICVSGATSPASGKEKNH